MLIPYKSEVIYPEVYGYECDYGNYGSQHAFIGKKLDNDHDDTKENRVND